MSNIRPRHQSLRDNRLKLMFVLNMSTTQWHLEDNHLHLLRPNNLVLLNLWLGKCHQQFLLINRCFLQYLKLNKLRQVQLSLRSYL